MIEITKVLDYNPDTGVFVWAQNLRNGTKAGSIAGAFDKNGYRVISINSRQYSSARLAFLFVHQRWPCSQIDHINGVHDDNRIKNLREVTVRQNAQNRVEHRRGGLVGAHRLNRSKRNPWAGRIRVNGIARHLGVFKTEQDAHEAYLNACSQIL